MLDLAMLFTPVCIGLFFGQVFSLVSNPLPEAKMELQEDKGYPKEWDEPMQGMVREAREGARKQVMGMAKRALEACPDVSCDQVAEALGLSKMSVRRLSKGGRRGKKVQTNYSTDEIKELSNAVF